MICKTFLTNASKGSYIYKEQNQGQAQRMELLSDYSCHKFNFSSYFLFNHTTIE